MSEQPTGNLILGRMAPCIAVVDIRAAQAFYANVFGLETVFENGNPVGFMVLRKDGAEVHLNRQRDHKASVANVAHLFVNDASMLYERCRRLGVRIIKALSDKEYGQRAFVIADPDGNRIDVGERIG